MAEFDSPQEANPFAAPAAEGEYLAAEVPTDAEEIRRKYIKHEESIKSIGLLYYLGAMLSGLGAIPLLAASRGVGNRGQDTAILIVMFFVWTVTCPLSWYIARGLRKFDRRVRVPFGALQGIGLLGIPLGTIISAYFLWLVFGEKGKYVFSDEYQAIIEQTPHVKIRGNSLLLLLIIAGVVALIISVGIVAGNG